VIPFVAFSKQSLDLLAVVPIYIATERMCSVQMWETVAGVVVVIVAGFLKPDIV